MKDKPVILVVDDQLQNIELLEAYLVPQGYEIIRAANGEEALGRLSGNQIDLILLDVMMPGMDGFEVTRRIRQDDKNRLLPIILVTALRETEDRVKGIEAGCDDFLSKPIDKTELLARIQSLLKVKAYHDLMGNYQKELESEVTRRTKEKDELVSKLQESEEVLSASEEKYRSLVENINDVLYTLDTQGNITYISPVVERFTGYKASDLIGKPFTPLIHTDDLSGLMDNLNSLASGQVEPWDFRVLDKDGRMIFVRSSSRPLYKHGKVVGITALMTDITDRKLSEEKLLKSYENLQKTLNDAINTMAKIVETRDPYTAGHQQKVADLAIAIATEMKLEGTQIDQLRMAAVIHDIGKMYVPSEILSKPGRLSEIEFMLVKTHAQFGYDIVKGMDFPGNIARAILQHHERLDGSGYPNQLKDKDTLLEAKILAVADVIEAMAAHRPYRPALGIEKALEEISKNKGRLYDPDVVDTCMELFSSGKFEFKPV